MNKIRNLLIALFIAMLSVTSQASQVELGIARSMHLATENEFNEFHPSIRYVEGKNFIGAFKNSEGTVSAIVGKRLESDSGFFMEYGLNTGYVVAPILPFLRLGKKIGAAPLFMGPGVDVTNNSIKKIIVVGIELTFNLNT